MTDQNQPHESLPSPVREPSSQTQDSDRANWIIDRVFTRMQSIYGHKFSSQWPSNEAMAAAKAEWRIQVANLPPTTIANALMAMQEKYQDFPPTLPQFVALTKPEIYPYQPIKTPAIESETVKQRRRETADHQMRQLYEQMGWGLPPSTR